VLSIKLSHIITPTLSKTFLSLCFMFSCLVMKAQTDTVMVDAVKDYDENAADDYSDDKDKKKKDYFLKKGEYDSLRFQQRSVPDSALRKMQEEKDFWYPNTDAKKGDRKTQPKREVKDGEQYEREPIQPKEEKSYNPISSQAWFQTLMWIIIIGGFAGAIMWYLAGSNVGLFRRKDKKIATGEEEEITEDIFAINYQKEIDKAAVQGNYRLAIRLMYLRLLKNLSERNIIQYKQDRTNLDYLMQLHPTVYYKNFFRITRHYEYSWYGEFNVSNDAYGIIKKEFDNFENTTG
jgi:hypothetical protein